MKLTTYIKLMSIPKKEFNDFILYFEGKGEEIYNWYLSSFSSLFIEEKLDGWIKHGEDVWINATIDCRIDILDGFIRYTKGYRTLNKSQSFNYRFPKTINAFLEQCDNLEINIEVRDVKSK
jgi:hypothetical protein